MDQDLFSLIGKSKELVKLPLLPKNIHILMKALADENLSYPKLAEVILNYPDISARLIHLSNSAWSSPVAPITEIELACSRLGTSIVKSLCIALSVSSHFNPARCPEFNTERYWTTSLLVAEGAGLLAAKIKSNTALAEQKNSAQTAGILHNIGLLWLAENLPNETTYALRTVLSEPALTVREAFHQRTSVDHCIVGGWIGKQWNFPDFLIAAIRYHFDLSYQEQYWEMALIVGSAAAMVANIYKNEEAPLSARMELHLGVSPEAQRLIFQTLHNNLEKTKGLVRILFNY